MDLDHFNLDGLLASTSAVVDASTALKHLNEEWYSITSRKGRRMDLIGDYAGNELFLIDGESLLQEVLDDPLLALGRDDDISFQVLHAIHTMEQLLENIQRRSASFEIVFWDEIRHSTLRPGTGLFQHASRGLARAMMYQHLKNTRIPVHVFRGTADEEWHDYIRMKKPMFVMLNDASAIGHATTPYSAEIVLVQRVFMFDLLSQGISITLLHGTEFRDSKIISLVLEQRQDQAARLRMPPEFWSTVQSTSATLETQENKLLGASPPHQTLLLSSFHSPSTSLDIDVAMTELVQICRPAIEQPYWTELFFVFVAHGFIVPMLSVEERARPIQVLDPKLQDLLRNVFLPRVFLAMQKVQSQHALIDMDGRVFVDALLCIWRTPDGTIDEMVGEDIVARVESIWDSLDLPDTDFTAFAAAFEVPEVASPTSSLSSLPEPYGILPFSNHVFDDILDPVDMDVEITDDAESPTHFSFNQAFIDTSHWHNHRRAILPKHLGGDNPKPTDAWQRAKQLRRDQNFKKQLQWQAKTLTGAFGAILEPIVITRDRPSEDKTTKNHAHTGRQPKKEHVSSAEKIRRANAEKKQADADKSNRTWWAQELTTLKKMTAAQRMARLEALQRNERRAEPGSWLAVVLRLYELSLQIFQWSMDPDREHPSKGALVRHKFTVAIMSRVKTIFEGGGLWPSAIHSLKSVLSALGFAEYAASFLESSPNPTTADRKLGFDFPPFEDFMRITEHPILWQMRLFGEHMDRSMDSQSDKRVSFKPDAWQRKVLDCLDANESVLVVAPTSAGKTFISYYAMEKVLRGSDEDILVYIAPTKALVTQIAAEVYGRFSKSFSNSRSCWAIHTRDYRINDPTNCQILITVPEILATLLLSPPLARAWTPKIKWIILDEIHTIGQQEGGAVWEQIILLAPCPIIGLSATIGQPEQFNAWLESVQIQHGFRHNFIHHPHRYSHLRKFTYNMQEQHPDSSFPGLERYTPTPRLQFLHPVSLLASGARALPPDFSLESRDCLTLYNTLHARRSKLPVDIGDLKPSKYFKQPALLRQKDILAYEAQLKDVLLTLMEHSDPRDTSSSLQKVISGLQNDGLAQQDSVPGDDVFLDNILYLLSDLHANGDLPALLFQFDRKACEVMAIHLLSMLEANERKWRESSHEWTNKIRKWEQWRAGAKERQRQAEKTAKKKQKQKEDEEDPRTDVTSSWEETFDPDDPSSEFSFVGKSAYTKGDLEEAIQDMAWVSGIPKWAIDALRRGIAVHHSGMNKRYRSLVESLYRLGFVRVIICTGTLALGINAPTKTSVFCGDSPFLTALMYRQCAGRAGRRGFDLLGKVVFYGIAMDRVQRLVLSRLPSLGGNFPMTSTMVLRLFNLLEGSDFAPFAENAIRSLLRLPHITFTSDIGRDQLLHHTRFSIDYLRRSGLLDSNGHPIDLFGVAAHLYYTEPSNLALVALLRHGVIHRICNQSSMIKAQYEFMLVMSHLFGRRYLPRVYTSAANVKDLIRKSPSMVVLPSMPADARNVLLQHDVETLRVFSGYALTYASGHDDSLTGQQLPISGKTYPKLEATQSDNVFRAFLQSSAVQVTARSPFVANSGHNDDFASVPELTRTARRGLHLSDHAIPSLDHITALPDDAQHPFALNAYLLDYYIHGQKKALVTVNGIREGDLWYLLEDFNLVLKALRSSLEKLLLGVSKSEDDADDGAVDPAEMDELPTSPRGASTTVGQKPDSSVMDKAGLKFPRTSAFEGREVLAKESTPHPRTMGQTQYSSHSETPATAAKEGDPPRPPGVTDSNWNVFLVIHRVTLEFEKKFKAMWA